MRLLPILIVAVALAAPWLPERGASASEAVSVLDEAEVTFDRRPPRPRPRPPRGRRPARAPAQQLGEPDLWFGVDLGPVLYPTRPNVNLKFDMGVGRRHGRGLIAGNFKIGVNLPMYFATEFLLEAGGTLPAKSAQPFAAFQVGLGVTVDSPIGTAVWEYITPGNKNPTMPTFILGGSFGLYAGEMKRKTQFRLSVQPRFRGMVASFQDGHTDLLPVAELSFCLGADVL